MGSIIAYMLTWPTYGSWLQGDEKGYVKDGVPHGKDCRLLRANEKKLQKPPVKLSKKYKQIVSDEIRKTAEMMGQQILSMAVCSNHVHIVVSNIDMEIASVVRKYKYNTTYIMQQNGVEGRVWAKGYDKRFCYDEKSLQGRIEYVRRHCEE